MCCYYPLKNWKGCTIPRKHLTNKKNASQMKLFVIPLPNMIIEIKNMNPIESVKKCSHIHLIVSTNFLQKYQKKRYTSIQRKFSSRPPCNLMHTHSFKFSFNSFLSPNFHSSCIWLKHYTFSLHIFISCSIVLFGSMKCIFIK